MKLRPILITAWIVITFSAFAQVPSPFSYQPSFSAVIVKNIDQSVEWYKSVFSLNVKERMGDEKTDYRVVILESPTFTLELLQLKGPLDTKEILSGKPESIRIQGHFKVGFKVVDMNACLQQLEKLNVEVTRVYTDSKTQKRNFLITDPDGNLIQFFE